jgi:hypothetical protein
VNSSAAVRRSIRRRVLGVGLVAALAVSGAAANGVAGAAPAPATGPTPISLTPGSATAAGKVTGSNVGFSVESADLAHGYLTKKLMAPWLRNLGDHGVLRLGGYSMDLVWPAFGAFKNSPAPAEAIGGTVDQTDFDNLKKLLDATGWKVTLGVPLKAIIDQSLVKDLTKDPSPHVTIEQAVAEVKAAKRTLGDDLVAVEIGNEYDNVTTMTPAQYYATLKDYHAAIADAIPGTQVKVTGPSANTAKTNTQLDGFIAAVQADTSVNPRSQLSEVTNHLYPGSHCGTSTYSIPSLMSATTYTGVRDKLQGIMDITGRLNDGMPASINETNSASCSGMPGVSDAYATSLWSLDYLMQSAQAGISRLQFHTNTAAVCGDFQQRTSPNYPVSYRYYGAFCAKNQAALGKSKLNAAPLYYGLWAFSQVPAGKVLDVGLPDSSLGQIRAYAVQGANGKLTMVLVNPQDPAVAGNTTDAVTVNLPESGLRGRAVTLRSGGTNGLASLDASRITLGGASVADGTPTGAPHSNPVQVSGTQSTLQLAPGTAQIVTFTR